MASASSVKLFIVQIQSPSAPLHQPPTLVYLASGLFPIVVPTSDWFDLPKPPDVIRADFSFRVGSIGGNSTPQRNCFPIGTISDLWELNGSQVSNDCQVNGQQNEYKGKKRSKPATGRTSELHGMGLTGQDDQTQDITGSIHKSFFVEGQVAHLFEPVDQE